MHFFYIEDTGTRDPEVVVNAEDKQGASSDHLYVMTAVGISEFHWRQFDKRISRVKMQFLKYLYQKKRLQLDLTDCEIKSTWMRIPQERKKKSKYLSSLSDEQLSELSDAFYQELETEKLTLFSVVIDKRELRQPMSSSILYQRAYTMMLELIELYMNKEFNSHQAMIFFKQSNKTVNDVFAENNSTVRNRLNHVNNFRQIVEYPFFADSRLSHGLQMADLCSYNAYRAFREEDFEYPFFQKILPHYYNDLKQGVGAFPTCLRVWPTSSALNKQSLVQ